VTIVFFIPAGPPIQRCHMRVKDLKRHAAGAFLKAAPLMLIAPKSLLIKSCMRRHAGCVSLMLPPIIHFSFVVMVCYYD
jgi:hypothetical protein